MRFYLGEIYEGDFPDGRRQAVVVALADDGRKGKLRFTNIEGECTVLWAELHQTWNWRRVIVESQNILDGE